MGKFNTDDQDNIKAFFAMLHKLACFAFSDIACTVLTTGGTIVFIVWVYALTIHFSIYDLVMPPCMWFIGARLGYYGPLGLIPGGAWIKKNKVYTIVHSGTTWLTKLTLWSTFFYCFNFKYIYLTKELIEGDPDSKREVTGPIGFVMYIGPRGYVFSLN